MTTVEQPARRRGARRFGVATVVLLVIAGANTVTGSLAALTAQTRNPSTAFSTGTVVIADNSSGSTLFTLTAAEPGSTASGCIRVTSTGSLPSGVHLYGTVSGTLASYVTLTVTRGADTAPAYASCTNFAPDSTNYLGSGNGVIYSGTLSAYPSTYAGGITDPTSSASATWAKNDAHSYKFTVTLANDNAAQGLSATATFTWEARNG